MLPHIDIYAVIWVEKQLLAIGTVNVVNACNDTKTGIVAKSRKNMQQVMAMQVFLKCAGMSNRISVACLFQCLPSAIELNGEHGFKVIIQHAAL